MQNNKTTSQEVAKKTYKKGNTLALFFITLFGVFFLSGMGLITNDYVGAGLLGGQLWFFWTVVGFICSQIIVFTIIFILWIIKGVKNGVIRSLYLYCWALLFVCSFVVGLQSAVFGALNAQVMNLGFVNFGNIFSSIWIILMAFVVGLWIYVAITNKHLNEHRYKVVRNYLFWIIALSLFIFHFEQASSGALGVDSEKVLLNTNLGDTITSSLTGALEEIPNIIGNFAFEHKPFITKIMENNGMKDWKINIFNNRMSAEDISGIVSLVLTTKFPIVFADENAFVLSAITLLFGKGPFWGLNNSWSGWTILVTVIIVNFGISGYALNRFWNNDVHNVDNPFFVRTPIYIIIFTIFMYSINAYIVTFIGAGSLNPGIVGSHIGHLQQDVPADATVIEIIRAHWMFNIMKYPVGDTFRGSYTGTIWWWSEWAISFAGLNIIITWCSIKHKAQMKADYIARKKSLAVKKFKKQICKSLNIKLPIN